MERSISFFEKTLIYYGINSEVYSIKFNNQKKKE